jgi:transcriptional regulator with XRE-family HTH domain
MPPRVAAPTSIKLPALLYWRIKRGITQRELAEKVGMRRASIARIEAGYPALLRSARQIAEALGIEIDDLRRNPPDDD